MGYHGCTTPRKRPRTRGTVYLIHFSQPLKHAKHYIGFAADVDARMAEHRAGTGGKLLAELNRLGIEYQVVRVWEGDRKLERKLKRGKRAPRLCPVCRAKRGKGREQQTINKGH